MPTDDGPPAAGLGKAFAASVVLSLIVLVPFAFVRLPPLVDAPYHLGHYAVQAAGPDSPLRQYFDFHWSVRLNLGVDLLIEMLRHAIGLYPAFYLSIILIPVLTASAIVALGTLPGRSGWTTTFWALLFVYNYPFNYGFLNYTLGMALSLLGFVLWVRLERRPHVRGALFLVIVPALLLCHAVGGGLLPAMIVAQRLGQVEKQGRSWVGATRAAFPRLVADLWPLIGAVLAVLVWQLADRSPTPHGPGGAQATAFGFHQTTYYSIGDKLNGLAMALRDQNKALDLSSVAALAGTMLIGRLTGARYTRPYRAVVILLAALFVCLPTTISGAWGTDVRIIPALAIMALMLQDWRPVPLRVRQAVMIAGASLFLVRLALTTVGFYAYDRAYEAERSALPHIARGARVLTFFTHPCHSWHHWRFSRLDHLSTLAAYEREAWTNSQFDSGDTSLLRVRFRPSPDFYHDPSHYVWPAECTARQPAPTNDDERRDYRRTIAQVMPMLPLDRVDYLWLIATPLPPGPWQARLRPVWTNGHSTLYRTPSP